jgi:hypothetical protein
MQCILYKIYFFGKFFICTVIWYAIFLYALLFAQNSILVKTGCYNRMGRKKMEAEMHKFFLHGLHLILDRVIAIVEFVTTDANCPLGTLQLWSRHDTLPLLLSWQNMIGIWVLLFSQQFLLVLPIVMIKLFIFPVKTRTSLFCPSKIWSSLFRPNMNFHSLFVPSTSFAYLTVLSGGWKHHFTLGCEVN